MRSGAVLARPTLQDARDRAARELASLPEGLRRLDRRARYPVEVAPPLRRLAEAVDRRTAGPATRP
jgi:nicotinate phosphoribosyltransferase